MIACVFSIDIFNVSSTFFHLSESLHGISVCLYPSIHPVQQGKQQSSQPRHSANPDGWSKPITAALPCFGLLVSLLPWHPPLSELSPCITHSSYFYTPIFLKMLRFPISTLGSFSLFLWRFLIGLLTVLLPYAPSHFSSCLVTEMPGGIMQKCVFDQHLSYWSVLKSIT